MSSLVIETPPKQEPLTIELVKNHLRVDISDDDELIKLYWQASREAVEGESGRSLVNKVYCQSHDHFPRIEEWQAGSGFTYNVPRYSHRKHEEHRVIKLLRSPLVNVQKITYLDTSGTLQTLYPTPEQWQAGTDHEIGDQIADPSGNLQEVTAVNESETGGSSKSGSSTPSWSGTIGLTTADGDLTWTNKKLAPAGDFLVDRDSEPARITPNYGQVWPYTLRVIDAVKVYYVAGYGDDAADAPASLKVAMLQGIGVSYENREAITPEQLREMTWYERLICSQRVQDWSPTP